MFDLALIAAIVLPLAAVNLAGFFLTRGYDKLAAEQQALRKLRISWITAGGLLVQVFGVQCVLEQWGDQMPLAQDLGMTLFYALNNLRELTGQPGMFAASFVGALLMMVFDLLLFYLPAFRIDRLAKGIDGTVSVSRQQVKLGLRSTMVTMLPILAWSSAVPLLLQTPGVSMYSVMLMFLAYLFVMYSVAPLMIRMGQPTEALSPEHPVTVMARALCRNAGVRVSEVRLIRFGEARIANAMVSGLLPWYRSIYVTDRMLETFTPDEIRAILAHEVGHVKKMHLWWYLALGAASVIVMTQTQAMLAQLLSMPHSQLPGNVILLTWWCLGFPFFSRMFERQADRYGLLLTGDAAAFARALEKLATVNCSARTTGIGEWFGSHPDIDKRIAAAMR